MLLLLIILIILAVITSQYLSRIDAFQSVRINDDRYIPIDWIPTIRKRNKILTLPVLDYYSCQHLCETTPSCDGFNFALNECTLYNRLNNPIINNDKYRC